MDTNQGALHRLSAKTSDLDLIMESLRERCLYEKVLKDDKSSVLLRWYQYMYNFITLSLDSQTISASNSYKAI